MGGGGRWSWRLFDKYYSLCSICSAWQSSRRSKVTPHEDYGFFGPDSVTWRVWTYPTSLTIGFQRSVVVEELDPALIAAVDQTDAVRYRPRTRYDRTLRYFATVSLGDSRSAIKASDVLVKIHAKAVGIEPLSGNPYDANDPHSQLWIHLTAWHSILYAYERYGPGRLSPEDESPSTGRSAPLAAELQTCDPADVPRSREGIRQYFEEMRPKLAGSEAAQSMMDHLLNAEVMLPPVPRALRPVTWVINKAMRWATIATMPQWMRKMAGLRQSRIIDALITPVMKVNFAVAPAQPAPGAGAPADALALDGRRRRAGPAQRAAEEPASRSRRPRRASATACCRRPRSTRASRRWWPPRGQARGARVRRGPRAGGLARRFAAAILAAP